MLNLSLLIAFATAPASADSVLVSADWLARRAADRDLVVIQVGWDAKAYRAAHIPGARFLPMESFTEQRDGLRVELPSLARLEAALEMIGISDRSRVILYGPPIPVSRLFVTLEAVGMAGRVAVLDGGLDAWRASGGQVTANEQAVARGSLTLVARDVFADARWVEANRSRPGVRLIDARAPRFFTGEDDGHMPRAGRIPGASNIPFTSVADDRGDFLDRAALARDFVAAGVKPGNVVVAYCHIGMQASVLYVAARALGHRARLYDGSFEEWSRRAELPVVTGPGAR